jgi:cyclohexa-1,5-dienecarbonyl-CoA hydratase
VLDTQNCRELAEKLKEISQDKSIAAVLLSGEGKCFSAGASVEEHKKELAPEMIAAFTEACSILSDLHVPCVALVHGFCFGGALELALYCDFIYADPSAKFSVPEITLAFFPPYACSALPGIIGRQNAAQLIFTGETVDGDRAYSMGLVQKIIETSEWDKLSHQFNKLSAPVVQLAKEAFKVGLKNPSTKPLEPIVDDLFLSRLYKIEDVNEGISSFNEKRKPEWKHR